MSEEDTEELQKFHNEVREIIISLLLFILLYVCSYAIITRFKKRTDTEDYVTGDDDAFVFRVSLWLCTFTLAVSAGAVLLLPISIISNEVLLAYPHSYYVEWLKSSLIHGLWTKVFLFSNMALFLFMPFAYFLSESEGFSGSNHGILARFKESAVMLILFVVIVFGVSCVIFALFDKGKHGAETLTDIWNGFLPYLYPCISFLGVIFLLACTPLGFACMFSSVGKLVLKPSFLRDIEDELTTARFTEESVLRRIRDQKESKRDHTESGRLSNGHSHQESMEDKLKEVRHDITELEKRTHVSCWRILLYPILMLSMVGLTVYLVLMVFQNTFQLLVGFKGLPVAAKEIDLGISSLSALGWFGSVLETILILYLMSASLIGFYSLPYFSRIQPKYQETSLRQIIYNCSVLLILSSALPVLSRTLGITNFDLVGDFGTMYWLGNFYIILCWNVVFMMATVLCLINKFTITIRRGIMVNFRTAFESLTSYVRLTVANLKRNFRQLKDRLHLT